MAAEDSDTYDFGDDVDEATFDQILEMDDEEEPTREFSQSIVFGFLEQAEATFAKMDNAMTAKDLPELSSLGHFLKGSSATLGYNKIKDECERIQNYGHLKDEVGNVVYTEQQALELISKALSAAKNAFDRVNVLMRRFYEKYSDS